MYNIIMDRQCQVTEEQRRVANRSGKQPCEICLVPEILVQHHLNGREVPRWNEPWNTCNICSNCHSRVHNNLIIIEGWFQTTNGRQLIWRTIEDLQITGQATTPYVLPREPESDSNETQNVANQFEIN